MSGILLAKLKLFLRKPGMFIIMTVMSIAFAFILGGANAQTIQIPVYAADKDIQDSVVAELLNESDVYVFNWVTKEEMEKRIENGKAELGLELHAEDFRMVVGVESQNINLVHQTVKNAYLKKMQYGNLVEALHGPSNQGGKEKEILSEMKKVRSNPAFFTKSANFRGADTELYDNSLHPLFGFTLFFVIYTIAYNVFQILVEKSDGVWDRVILSPVKKWEMYVANFSYSFLTGYLQVLLIFLVFRFLIGVDFHGNFVKTLVLIIPYVFAIVAVAILITGLVKTVQQFNAVIPIIAVSFAMIGGAYWPLEIVESKLMLALAKVVPVTYGMEVLNGAALYGYSITDLLYPISILLLMGVVMTGVGIHLMEKRHI